MRPTRRPSHEPSSMPTPLPSRAPVPLPSPSPTALLAGGGANGASSNSNGGAAASSNAGSATTTIIIIVVVAVVIIAAAAAAYYFLLQKKKEQHPALSFSEQYGVRPNQRDSFQGASPVYNQQQQQPRRSSVSVAASPGGPQRYVQGDARKSLRLSVADPQARSPTSRGQRPSVAHLAHARQPSPAWSPYGDGSDL